MAAKSNPPAIRERVRLHLTAAGWAYVAMVTMLGFAAARNGASLMLGVFGCLMGAMAFSAVTAWRTVRRVEIHRELPDRDWQYRTIHLGYYLHNRGRGPVLGLEVEEIAPDGIESAAGYCVSIPAGGTFRAGGRFVARRRGRIELPGIVLRTHFPFGLVRAVRQVRQAASIVVWPARGRLRRAMLRGGASETSSSGPSRASGGQDEFFGLREYRTDDNPRWIHWKRSATRGELVVREMSRARPEVLWIVLDTQAAGGDEQARAGRERMLRFAATLADHAFRRGYRVGLAAGMAAGVRVYEPGPGRGSRTELLDALAMADENTAWGLEATVAAVRGRGLELCQVVVVTAGGRAGRMGLGATGGVTVLDAGGLEAAFQDAADGPEGPACR